MSQIIDLRKDQIIDLSKEKPGIEKFCAGVNWGMMNRVIAPARTEIKKTGGFLGFGGKEEEVTIPAEIKKESVDLDLACAVYNANGTELDRVYFRRENLRAPGITHSGDDLDGDDEDDGIDNETIAVDLSKVNSSATEIVFVLNSFNQGQDFHATPFSRIRLYTGEEAIRPTDVVAEYKVDSAPEYAGKRAMVIGKLIKINNHWSFKAIGEITNDTSLGKTLETVKSKYLG